MSDAKLLNGGVLEKSTKKKKKKYVRATTGQQTFDLFLTLRSIASGCLDVGFLLSSTD